MKIKRELPHDLNRVDFGTLKCGDVFEWANNIYIVLHISPTNYNAVNVQSATLCKFEPDQKVTRKEHQLLIYE